MYTLGTFLVLFSSYYLLKAFESGKTKDWVWYAILAAAALYTHYFLLFSIAAQIFYILYRIIRESGFRQVLKNRYLKQALIAGGAMVLLYLPWIPSFLVQNARVQQSYWIPAMDRWSVPGTVWKMIFGGQGINRPTLLIATAAAVVLLVIFLKRTKEDARWLVALSLLVPF